MGALFEAMSRLPSSLRGALWMLASCLCFSAMIGLVRFVGDSMNAYELTFWRNVFGLAFMLPWLARGGRATLRTPGFRWHAFRAVTSVGSMLTWFAAITMMPLAEATALSFATPLFATIGAALFLGERVRLRRWSATAVGFVGTLVILRPGFEAVSVPAILALVSAALAAPSVLVVRVLARTDSPATIVLYMGLLATPLSAIPAIFAWGGPPLAAIGWVAMMGIVSTLGHLAFVRAVAVAEASAIMPFDFSRLVFVAFFAYVLFGERPDVWTWLGGAVVFAAALYTAHREARVEGSTRPATEVVRQSGDISPAPPPKPES